MGECVCGGGEGLRWGKQRGACGWIRGAHTEAERVEEGCKHGGGGYEVGECDWVRGSSYRG